MGYDNLKKKICAYVLNNPYRILGVAANATEEEIDNAIDKIKKLIHLQAVDSYISKYNLNIDDKPDRTISTIQHAFMKIKEYKFKWFWVCDENICSNWTNPQYRIANDLTSYDVFLVNYWYVLFFDPLFNQPSIWRKIFCFIDYLINEPTHAMLWSRFNAVQRENITENEMVTSFKHEIIRPIMQICEFADMNLLLRVYNTTVEVQTTTFGKKIRNIVISQITQWFLAQEEDAQNKLENNMKSVNKLELKSYIKECGMKYLMKVEKYFDTILKCIENETVSYKIIQESYRNITWSCAVLLQNLGDRNNAAFFAQKAYRYCKESDKQSLRNVFGNNLFVTNSKLKNMGNKQLLRISIFLAILGLIIIFNSVDIIIGFVIGIGSFVLGGLLLILYIASFAIYN